MKPWDFRNSQKLIVGKTYTQDETGAQRKIIGLLFGTKEVIYKVEKAAPKSNIKGIRVMSVHAFHNWLNNNDNRYYK